MIPHLVLFRARRRRRCCGARGPFSLGGKTSLKTFCKHGDIEALAGLIRRAARQPWDKPFSSATLQTQVVNSLTFILFPNHSVELHSFARSSIALTAYSFFSASRLPSLFRRSSRFYRSGQPIHTYPIHSTIISQHACQSSRCSGPGRRCQPRQRSRLRRFLDH